MTAHLLDLVGFLAGMALAVAIVAAGIAATPWRRVVFG